MGVCGVKVNDLNALKYGLRPGIKDIIIFATDKFVSVVVYYQPHTSSALKPNRQFSEQRTHR